ncbi:MAG TPA: tetratricopeptide repeat protein [Methanospirillum sp.]|nr:tetratricopeptide repeat protein [Methanospirillum sp.]
MKQSNGKTGLTTLLVLFFLWLSLTVPAIANETRQDNFGAIELYNKAVDAASSGNFNDALNLTGEALAIQPNFTVALVTRAGVLIALDRPEEAEDTVNRALVIDPANPSVLATASSLYIKTGDHTKALTFADTALDADPSLIEAWILKGTAHGALKEYPEELNASKSALALDPNNQLAKINYDFAQSHITGQPESVSSDTSTTRAPVSLPVVILGILTGCTLIVRRIERER